MNIKHTLTWVLLATLLSASTPADIKFTPAETQQISISTPGLFDKSKAFSIDFTSMGDRAYSFPLPVGKLRSLTRKTDWKSPPRRAMPSRPCLTAAYDSRERWTATAMSS